MKIQHLFPLLMLTAALALIGCSPAEPGMDLPEPSGDYTMTATQNSYPADAETIEVIITNNTAEESGYGMGYSIERYKDGEWEKVPLEFAVIEIYAILEPGGSNTQEIALYQDQYKYTPGEYRVIKQIGDESIAAAFSLG